MSGADVDWHRQSGGATDTEIPVINRKTVAGTGTVYSA